MVNRVIVTGYIGADPDVKTMPSGDLVANVRIASTERYRDKSSSTARESTEWHRVVFYGGLADVAKNHLVKGSRVFVDGRLRTRKWTANDGQDKYVTEIVVEHLEMLGGPRTPAASIEGVDSQAGDDWTQEYDRAAAAEHQS